MDKGDIMILGQKPSIFFLIAISFVLIVSIGLAQTPENKKPPTNEGQKTATPVIIYKTFCGQCHMAFPPNFLPSSSWLKLLDSEKDHFGNPLDLDPQTKTILVQFLTENGADKSQSRISSKIMDSLDENEIPLRLTEVPYINYKHRKISQAVLQKKSIGSLANCNACHRSATDWAFNKWVNIPD
jgi:hypothetical protein